MANDKLLSTSQAATELNVHRSTLTRMVKNGEIKEAVRGEGIRGAMFFYPSEIRKAKARLNSSPATPTPRPVGDLPPVPAGRGFSVSKEDAA